MRQVQHCRQRNVEPVNKRGVKKSRSQPELGEKKRRSGKHSKSVSNSSLKECDFSHLSCVAGGFTSHFISHKSGFHKKYPIKGQHFVQLLTNISSTFRGLHTGSGVGASYWVSPRPSSALRRFTCCSGVGADVATCRPVAPYKVAQQDDLSWQQVLHSKGHARVEQYSGQSGIGVKKPHQWMIASVCNPLLLRDAGLTLLEHLLCFTATFE